MKTIVWSFFFAISFFSAANAQWINGVKPTCANMNTQCTKRAIATGNWDDANIWSPVGVPDPATANSIICIPSGITVTVRNQTQEYLTNPVHIFVCGTVFFDAGAHINLHIASTFNILVGGKLEGKNPSTYLTVGTQVWNGPDPINGPYYVSGTGQGAGVLPVVLGEFKAEVKQPFQINLQWSTFQEQNSDLFVVERSADNNNWTDIGSVKAAGNSSIHRIYTFTDLSPLIGNNFYRLRQLDLDGKTAFSGIVRVTNSNDAKGNISIFPNPAQAIANIYIKQGVTSNQQIQVFNNNGAMVKTVKASAGNMVQVDTRGMAAGLYMVRLVESGRTIEQTRMIKQ